MNAVIINFFILSELNWRPVLAGFLLLIFRLPSTVVDIVLFADQTRYKDAALGGFVLVNVCLIYKTII